jgi:Uma2 family endonuclease
MPRTPHPWPHDPPPHRPDYDEALWHAWTSLEPPEGYRAEIIDDRIDLWPVGPHRHGMVLTRLLAALHRWLPEGPHAAACGMYLVHGHRVWRPDLALVPVDDGPFVVPDDMGLDAACVAAVAEVTTLEQDGLTRDRVRKRRSYAQAGIPVYVLIDDYDGHGTVSILTSPSPGEGVYAAETCVPYGTEVVIPEGPAKGFVIDESITGPLRD